MGFQTIREVITLSYKNESPMPILDLNSKAINLLKYFAKNCIKKNKKNQSIVY